MKTSLLLFFTFVLCNATQAAAPNDLASRLVQAARSQVGVTLGYDPQYRRLPYPGGDVPITTGVCTDVVIRAYRALGLDLQVQVHEDMKRAPGGIYPKRWGPHPIDPNIDHRRVPNLQVFLKRHATSVAVSQQADDYQPGDIVTWNLPGNHPHIGLVSTKKISGRPLVIHNIGQGTQENDVLFSYVLTGHYRYQPVSQTRITHDSNVLP